MHKIDQEKLSEFTNELAAFQTEASKTASVDVYDRFTISKLEDHVVDLCQLSIDASHTGLQYLCERLRDNIRDHFITGTNISNQEFALMKEWKSLVKAYLLNSENKGVVDALASNLAKPDWTYPLSSDDTEEVVSVLLGKSLDNQQNSILNNNALSSDESEDFDVLMAESNTSLADVFESFNDDDSEEESIVDFIEDDEPSIAEFFEENEFSKTSDGANQIDEVNDTEGEDLSEIDEKDSGTLANDIFAAEIEKVEVSAQELEEIDQTVSNNTDNELFASDDSADESDYSEEFDKDISNADAAMSNDADVSIEKVEVSAQELEEIDQTVSNNTDNELFASDDNDSLEETAQMSDEVSSEVDRSVVESLANDLFVADESDNELQKNAQSDEALPDTIPEPETVYIEPVQKKSEAPRSIVEAYVDAITDKNNDKPRENIQLDESTSEAVPSQDSASQEMLAAVVDELFDEEENIDDSEPVLDTDHSQASSSVENEPETVYVEPVKKKPEAPRSIIEAYVGVIADKIRGNKPKELEQELIQEPPKPTPIQKLEPVDSILLKYPDWSEEQKELLSLILSEVHDVIDQQDETLAVLHQDNVVEQDVLDMVSLYSEQIERMSSAAEMVGLDALQKLCELIGFHFGDLEKSSTEMIVSSEERIRKWPFIIHEYLKNIHNEKSHEEAIDYISDAAWARTIREDIKTDLKEAFSCSTIHIEKTEEDLRITKASAQDVVIAVPDDVQAELLDGLLQELPRQTEEFSKAIQQLIKDDYLTQLEVTQRIAHTIKGAANTVGIVGVATLTHHLEDILQALLKAKAKPNSDLHNALIDASDCLEQMTECLLGQRDQPDDAVKTMQVILDWANYIDESGVPKDDVNQSVSSVNAEQSKATEKTDVIKEDAKTKPSQDASLRVSANMIDSLINQSGESIIATSQMYENVNKLLACMREIKKNKDNVYSLSQKLEHLIDIQGTNDKFSNENNNEKFDPLELDQYNELHTYSRRLIEATADSVELIKDLEDRLFSLESVVADQSRVQKDNQYAMLKTRMMPVESVVARLKRSVRQAAKISGKSVELDVLGVDIQLDSKILNNLIDPLMHLLRNAVDHGIESNEVREANGKPLPAVIKLSFAQVGERLEINCQDDGNGLDAQTIKARAIDKGMILNDQELSDDEIHQIIMQHGFSTRDEVTQLSGRGVGMDVVSSNIKELNGSINISSELSKGMNVELSLPVSLLTAHALLIPAVSGSMAVSTNGVEEIIQVNLDDLVETEQGLMLQIEDEKYPAIHLEQLLHMRLSSPSNKQQSCTALLVDEFGGQKKIVLVNEIQSVRDIIIKPISHYLPKVVGLVGATVLGNGDIAPVVDVADMLSQQSNVIGKFDAEYSTDLEETYQASVLVVEDSISTRRSLAEFMQDLNYKVFTAKDGVEAIEIMRDHPPVLLLTDLEMPRMNGLELTSYVRSHDETKDIPIIMLTSRTTEKHRQEAQSIGVNEYLSKPFIEDILLEKVQGLTIPK
jgi:chemosensory pili system protein ChpA (sensor histidine kinase/response regulator)